MSENREEFMEQDEGASENMQNREAEEDALRQEKTKRRKEKELMDLKKLEQQILEKMNKENKKLSQLSLESSAWETVFVTMIEELKRKEEELEQTYESIWQNREKFCSKVDGFIRELEKFTKSKDNAHDAETERRRKDIQQDMESLGMKIAEKEAAVETLDQNLGMLESERMKLLVLREGTDVVRLEDWITITCEKCADLEQQIVDKKRHITEKNADIIQLLGSQNNLFSKVSLDDVKNLSPFKTDPKPSSSSNLSFD